MTLVLNRIFADYSLPVKRTLVCYRALSDAKYELKELESRIQNNNFMLSSWKVPWVGICAVLRTSFEVIGKVDARSCIDSHLRDELKKAWNRISKNKNDYPLFWKFLKNERDEILHQYDWKAYEAWLDSESGQLRTQTGLLDVRQDSERTVLVLKRGYYAGENSMDLLKQCAVLAETIIDEAIKAAGYDPDEEVFIRDFARVAAHPERRKNQRRIQSAILRTQIKERTRKNLDK